MPKCIVQRETDPLKVVPSNMNPVGEAGNMFSSLFDRVPAKRAGNEEDIAGSVIYLMSRAGVSTILLGLRKLTRNSLPR